MSEKPPHHLTAGIDDTSSTVNIEKGRNASTSNKKRKRSASKSRRSDKKILVTDSVDSGAAEQQQRQQFNSTKKSKKRKQQKKHLTDDETPSDAASAHQPTKQQSVGARNYPYPVDYNDHFETPLRAYTDILPLIQFKIDQKTSLKSKSKTDTEFIIYDPYFCTGRAATLLQQTFIEHNGKNRAKVCIQHEKRDFYKDVRKNTVPQHDILVTNPPYSGNHKERCLEFAVGQLKKHNRPFFLLMPNYVASKEYFRKVVLEDNVQNVFVVPSASQPYEYDHPEGTGKETSPFQSVWFCGLSYGSVSDAVTKTIKDSFVKYHQSKCKGGERNMPRIASSLQELIRIGGVSGEKRKNPRQRKKMRQLALQKANQITK